MTKNGGRVMQVRAVQMMKETRSVSNVPGLEYLPYHSLFRSNLRSEKEATEFIKGRGDPECG